jgi:hypothetical protein
LNYGTHVYIVASRLWKLEEYSADDFADFFTILFCDVEYNATNVVCTFPRDVICLIMQLM